MPDEPDPKNIPCKDRIMQNSEAVHHGMQALYRCIDEHPETDTAELREALELLHQLKKTEELRQAVSLSSSEEETLFDIFESIEELHWSQNITWILTKPIWMTIRNTFYCRTGLCLSRGRILKEYYNYRRETDCIDGTTRGGAILAGIAGLFSEIADVRGGRT